MRALPLDEFDGTVEASGSIAILFPFACPRSSGPGNPIALARRDAHDLFLLALLKLSSRFGEPDVPSFDAPDGTIDGSELRAIWNFDYYALVLTVAALEGERFGVRVTRLESS
jgi:hypothetical protein